MFVYVSIVTLATLSPSSLTPGFDTYIHTYIALVYAHRHNS